MLVLNFREHEKSMVKLRKLLPDSKKIRRRQRIFVNMNITFIAWLIEFLGGFAGVLMIFLPQQNITTRALQMLTGFMSFIVVPCAYLMNSSDIKSAIIDNKFYVVFRKRFFPHINQLKYNNNIRT